MDSWKNIDEAALPPKEAFYSNVNLEDINDEDYAHAKKVWDTFEMNNLGDLDISLSHNINDWIRD